MKRTIIRFKGRVIWVSILVITMMIGGCYETESPVLDRGERAPLAGTYQCANRIDGSKQTYTTVEEREGVVLTSYRYKSSDGGTSLLKKLPNGLYLAQIASTKGGFSYGYADFVDDTTYLLLLTFTY